MFFRTKRSGRWEYLQIVENSWTGGKSRQKVIATVGRLDKLAEKGELEALLQSGARFCNSSISYISSSRDDACMSTHQVSRLLQVSPSTVVAWVNEGKLSAFRTPGGHRRVRVSDIRDFLERNQMPCPPELRGPDRSSRVFVVDDDPYVIRAIQRSLKQHAAAYEVTGCEDGIEALVLIGALQPDLVLLDIYMEGIDGFEVCRRLRQMPHLQGVKIVAMTAHPSDEARARILDYGAEDYWVKPVRAEQVTEVLDRQKKTGLVG
jgi:excisionase family DNA binding protein